MSYSGKVINQITGAPMAGAVVSDGRHMAVTDENGAYVLPGWERSHWVCVCMLTCGHNDWFRYTGGKEGVYDFALNPAETGSFSLLQTSDTEINSKTDLEWLDFIREQIHADKPAFLIHTGDICGREGLERHKEVMNYETMGVPVRYVVGNHDFVRSDADYGEQYFEQLYGPLWWAFACGGVFCVVLSLGHGGRGDMPSGYEKTDQWAWVRNALEMKEPGMPMVIFCHDCGPDPYEFVLDGIDLKEHDLRAWIYGHAHSNLHHIRSGVHNICTGRPDSGGIDSSAAGIRYIRLEEEVESQMHYRRFPTDPEEPYVWKKVLPGHITFGELLADDRLYVGIMQDDKPCACGIYCLDYVTGRTLWKVPTEGGFHSNLCLDDSKLYGQDCAGNTYCLNARDGSLIWKYTMRFHNGADLVGADRTRFPALVAGDLVITGSATCTRALNKATGELVWQAPRPKKAGNGPARPLYDPEHHRLYISGQWGVLRCLDAASGEVIWEDMDRPLWYRTQTPCLHGDVIYSGGFGTMVKLDAATGQRLVEKDITEAVRALGAPDVASDGDMNACGAPAVDGDVLYVPTAASGVVAMDKNTLEVLRRYPVGPCAILTAPYVQKGAQTVESSPLILEEMLIFTASDGKVYFYLKDTGDLLRTICMPGPSLVAPVLIEDSLFTADFDGNICKYYL